MIIENMASKEQWDEVVIHLTRTEAKELKNALEAILLDNNTKRHEHIPSDDYEREITVLLMD